ncbi:unnamed protein product [Phytophthora fragariaefolia]|uniref:Unnamed protein product n=1 Tax=Phytophthora fragariaefolia TaxID=1490495 RepID=A0A9W6Y726_9STRA|nr:unnamed protein product [Phytophthora fragariaefolia]
MRIVPALRTTGQLCHRECRQTQVARRPPGPLRAEKFKLGGPPTLTGLDEAGLPQSTEPVAEAKYIFAYVGKAGRPERVWTDGNDGIKMDGIDGELDYSKEESRARISNDGATRLRKGAIGMTKTIKLLPGERLGRWSAQKFDRQIRMRALVMGALRLKWQASRDVQIGVQGIGKDKVGTSTRAWVKITLGWEVTYEFEVWMMGHHAGVDLILGTDFMIPAGIRLDLYNALAKLPDEVVVPLINFLNSADDPKGGLQITDGPTETICSPGRVTAEFRARRKQPAESTHELWVRRTRDWIPIVVLNKHGKVARVLLTNTKLSMTWCPAHFPVLSWAPHGILHPEGFVRLSSAKYRYWQVLAYETAIDKDLLGKERQLYDEWIERQPPAVELLETSDGLVGPVVSLTRDEDGSSRVLASAVNSAESAENDLVAPRVEKRGNPPDRGRQTGEISDDMLDGDPEKNLHLSYLLAAELDNDERGEGEPGRHDDVYERVPNALAQEDYAHELAFLPDLTDLIPTQIDYSEDNVVCSAHSAEASADSTTSPAGTSQAPQETLRTAEGAAESWADRILEQSAGLPHRYCTQDERGGHPPMHRLQIGERYYSDDGICNDAGQRLAHRVGCVPMVLFVGHRKWILGSNDDSSSSADLGFSESDPMQDFIDSPAADIFNTGEPDRSSWVSVFERRSFVDDICFGGRAFEECLDTLDRLLKRFAECRISVSFPKSIFVQPKVDFLSHKVTPEGIQADPKKMAAIAELPFPTTKIGMQAFLGALNYYGRFIRILAVYGAILYQIKEDDFAPGGDLTAAKAAFAELKTKVVEAPILRHFDSGKMFTSCSLPMRGR